MYLRFCFNCFSVHILSESLDKRKIECWCWNDEKNRGGEKREKGKKRAVVVDHVSGGRQRLKFN